MTRSVFLIVLSTALVAGCPHPKPKPNGKPRGPDVATLDKLLELPPAATTHQTLAELQRRAAKGDARARWARLRYLFSLYDFARLTGEVRARRILLRALGGTGREKRGRVATRLVRDRLATGLQAHARQRTAPGSARAGLLVQLVRGDQRFARDPKDLQARVMRLKSQLQSSVAAAARLRLYALCAQAFRVAVRAAPAQRSRVLNHCLYPLFGFDPAPHVRAKGAPPHPPWTDYRDRLQRLLDGAATGPRLSALVGLRSELDARFFRRNGVRLPALLHAQVAELPVLSAGTAHRGASVIVLHPTQLVIGTRSILKPRSRHFRVALTEAFFAGDRLTQVTLMGTRQLPMGRLAPLLMRAAATGFYKVGFGGVQAVTSRSGYWRRRRRVQPLRVRELAVSLAPISTAAATLKGVASTQLGWDRTCARHGLGVLLGRNQATAYGPDGRLAPSLSPRSTAEAMLHALGRLRDAFPTACGLRVSAEADLPYAEFLSALVALRSRRGAAAQFAWVGYAGPPAKSSASAPFANRVSSRLAAKVRFQRWPRRVRASRPALLRRVRPCYLHALDTLPTRWGRLEVHSAPGKTLVSQLRGTSPEELSLNRCIAQAVDTWRKKHTVDGPLRFRVQLKP